MGSDDTVEELLADLRLACGLPRAGRRERRASPFDQVSEIAFSVLCADDPRRIERVMLVAEAALAGPEPASVALVEIGLLEDMANVASHADTPSSPGRIRAVLPERCASSWDRSAALWNRSRPFRTDHALTLEKYDTVHSSDLRQQLQRLHRRLPDGTLVGLADVIRCEATEGGSSHMAKAQT